MSKTRLTMLKPRVATLKPSLATVPAQIRQSSSKLYGSYRWKQERAAFLAEHPLCECEECDGGRKHVRVATVVDHRIPHRGDLVLFWDRTNWQAMTKDCHDAKTAREDGGFGNPQGGPNG